MAGSPVVIACDWFKIEGSKAADNVRALIWTPFPESPALLEAQALLVGGLHIVMAGAVTVHALMTKRNVPTAIGWIGMAWLAPVLGSLLPVGYGMNRVTSPRSEADGIHAERRRSHHGRHVFRGSTRARLKAAIGMITGQGVATGKIVAILECGDQAYPQMLAAIEGATSSRPARDLYLPADELGRQFIEALARAHQRGVKIRVLIDGFGGGFLRSSAYHALRRRGVPGGPLPPFDAAVENAVPGSAPA